MSPRALLSLSVASLLGASLLLALLWSGLALLPVLSALGAMALRTARRPAWRYEVEATPTPMRVVGPVHIRLGERVAMPSERVPLQVRCLDCGRLCTPGPDGYPLAHSVGRGFEVRMCTGGRRR